jgi:hypothetical protein
MDYSIPHELLKTILTIPFKKTYHLISRGSETAYNCKHNYHIMIVVRFAKVNTMYPRVVISSLIKRVENLHVAMSAKAQSHCRGVRPIDHYMLLQWFTTGVCYALLWFPRTSGPTSSAKVSPDLGPLLHNVDPGHILHLSPCNLARLATYSIPNY